MPGVNLDKIWAQGQETAADWLGPANTTVNIFWMWATMSISDPTFVIPTNWDIS
jgi:hypothetical protein